MKPNLIQFLKSPKLLSGYILAPLLFFILVIFIDLAPGKPAVTYTLAVAMLMAVLWITEIVPLAVTALLPVVFFPVFGIMDGKDVSSTYFNHVIFLFIGGFMVALAMQKWNLHKRIALRVLLLTGTRPGSILFGFMLSSAILSMWISNTATAMMMVPIVISVLDKLEESMEAKTLSKYGIGLLLGVAYAASIGGIATLVGTPPNLSFLRIFHIMFPAAPEISFTIWMIYALPISIAMFMLTWFLLKLLFGPGKDEWASLDKRVFRQQYQKLGPMLFEEKVILLDFCLMALLWMTRSDLEIGDVVIPGWAGLFNFPEYINDGTVAIFLAVILFFIPSKNEVKSHIMKWETASKLPWHIVLLFGGGFALATGFKESGLSTWFGEQMSFLSGMHPILIILMISLMVTFLTELTSNTATVEMILPILAGLAVSLELNPLYLMLPAAISGSMAFMLPVATPPNTIIFGTNRVSVAAMARTGIYLNLAGAIVITLITYLLAGAVFGTDGAAMPAWATQP